MKIDVLANLEYLLHQKEEVSIPGVGVVSTRQNDFSMDRRRGWLVPASKQVDHFQPLTETNNEELVQFLAHKYGVSADEARNAVNDFVQYYIHYAQHEGIIIPNIGKIVVDEHGRVQFEPNQSHNYDKEYFGLPRLKNIYPVLTSTNFDHASIADIVPNLSNEQSKSTSKDTKEVKEEKPVAINHLTEPKVESPPPKELNKPKTASPPAEKATISTPSTKQVEKPRSVVHPAPIVAPSAEATTNTSKPAKITQNRAVRLLETIRDNRPLQLIVPIVLLALIAIPLSQRYINNGNSKAGFTIPDTNNPDDIPNITPIIEDTSTENTPKPRNPQPRITNNPNNQNNSENRADAALPKHLIVVGVFSNRSNAERKQVEVLGKGYNADIIEKSGGKYQVCIVLICSEQEVFSKIKNIRKDYSGAWRKH